MTLKELQEEKNALSKQVQDMAKVYNDAGQTWKDEEARSNWKKLNDDYNAKRDAVAKLVEANEIADAAKSAAEDETRSVNSGKVIPGRFGKAA